MTNLPNSDLPNSDLPNSGTSNPNATHTDAANTGANPINATDALGTTFGLDHLGELSERQLLRALEAIRVSGTLLLEKAKESSLTVLAEGRTLVSFEMPHALAEQELSARRFTLHTYALAEVGGGVPLPQLASSYPTSYLPVLQALPKLTASAHLVSSSLNPEALIQDYLAGSGIMVLERVDVNRLERGYVLVAAGSLQTAASERQRSVTQDAPDVLTGDDALKVLLGLEGRMAFQFIPLAPFMMASLLTLHGQPTESPSSYGALEADYGALEADVALTEDAVSDGVVSDGVPTHSTSSDDVSKDDIPKDDIPKDDLAIEDVLASVVSEVVSVPSASGKIAEVIEDSEDNKDVAASFVTPPDLPQQEAATPPSQALGSAMGVDENGYTFYYEGTACLRVVTPARADAGYYQQTAATAINLPDATANLIKKYYALTLRGRDALSPMMDLFRDVQKEFGVSGKQVLQALTTPQSSHDLLVVEPDPDMLQELLRRLERGGLIFEIDPEQHDVG
jgi:hypothetical protein